MERFGGKERVGKKERNKENEGREGIMKIYDCEVASNFLEHSAAFTRRGSFGICNGHQPKPSTLQRGAGRGVLPGRVPVVLLMSTFKCFWSFCAICSLFYLRLLVSVSGVFRSWPLVFVLTLTCL